MWEPLKTAFMIKEMQMNPKQSERSRSSASAASSSPADSSSPAEAAQPRRAGAVKLRRAGAAPPRGAGATAAAQGNGPASPLAAVDALVYGYSTELELYSAIRALAWRQRDTLCDGWNLERFGDLLDEKEDLLRMIGQIESAMKAAKSLVLSRKLLQCPNRWKLDRMLDQVAAMIEEISAVERANASLLEGALAAG
jgi:hypothetical protein